MSLNPYPLPEGTILTPGDYYGLRKPEYAGDPCAILPYSMVAHDMPVDCSLIQAVDTQQYKIVAHTPVQTDELDNVHGALPSLHPQNSGEQPARQRRGGPMVQPNVGLNSPEAMQAVNQGSPLSNGAPNTGLMRQPESPPPANSLPSGGSDFAQPPSGGVLAKPTPPAPPAKAEPQSVEPPAAEQAAFPQPVDGPAVLPPLTDFSQTPEPPKPQGGRGGKKQGNK